MKLLFIILIFCLGQIDVFGQSDSIDTSNGLNYHNSMKKDLAVITGYQAQKNHFAEIGIGIINDGSMGHQPIAVIYGISNEFKIDKDEDFIWGLKMGFWMNGGYSMGLNLINYTDFNTSSLRFRPEIGIGASVFRIVYGYNFAITNKEFMGINTHNFTINLLLKVKTLKEK